MLEKIFNITPTNRELLEKGLPKDLSESFRKISVYKVEVPPNVILVLIPAFNEEDSIKDVISRIPRIACGLKTQVLVINDGSTDNTSSIAESAGAIVLDMPRNSGQGAALKAGYLFALHNKTQFVAVVDADGQWDPSDLDEMMTPLVNGAADFVQGSRRLGTTEVEDRFRNLGVEFFTRLISLATHTPVGDTSSGYRAYNCEVLGKVRLHQRQYQSSEILISAIFSGARLYEHPVTMSIRTAGVSKKAANWKYGLLYLRAVLQTVIRDKYLVPLLKHQTE